MVKRKRARRKASPATRARLKALRKKHHLGEFKTSTPTLRKSRGIEMARRRRKVRYVTRRKSYRRRKIGTASMKQLVTGIAIASFLEPTSDALIDQFAGSFGGQLAGFDLKDIAKGVGGWYFGKKTRGIMRGVATGFMLIGVRNVVRSVAGQGLGTFFGGAKQTAMFQPTVL